MNNGKRSIALAMLILLSLPMATMLIKSVSAADVVGYGFSWWNGASAPNIVVTSSASMPGVLPPYHTNDTLVLNGYTWSDDSPLNVTFTVNNTEALTSGNIIVRVQFHLWESASNGAVFHYLSSIPGSEAWQTRILEKDDKGWARLVEFYLDPSSEPSIFGINPNESMNFTVTLGAKDPSKTLDYSTDIPTFVVTEAFTSSLAEDQYIYWYLAVSQPTVTVNVIPSPVNGNVTGLLYGTGCGHHYFNVTFTATDIFGLMNYTLSIAGPTTPPIVNVALTPPYPTSYTNVTQWIDFLDGSYTVTVTVFNRMSMSASASISFYYMHPQKPFALSTTSGFAAAYTWIADAASGLVNSTHFVYGIKEFGTIVPVSGYGFGVSQPVKVYVYIPTYDSYKSTYGSYEVLVASTTSDAYGNFSTSFIFPKAPFGTYNVTGSSPTFTCEDTFQVLPQIIYNPNDVIGPAVVNVEATGFPMPSVVPGPNNYNKILLLSNDKDTLLGIDSQALQDWYIDGNGTLQNVITIVLDNRTVYNGMVWPDLQPGTYNLTLVLFTNDQVNEPLWIWTSPTWVPIATNYFEHTNIITVEETLSLLPKIYGTVTDINATITRIDGNVVTLSTTVGQINTTLNELSPVITRIDGNVVTLMTTVGQMNTTLAAIGPQLAAFNSTDIATIKTTVGTISGTVTSIQGDTTTIRTDMGDVHGQLPTVTDYLIILIVLTLIAAIAAIACIFLVFSKIA